MTENNQDNNKNIFVKIADWCKHSFLHPTTNTPVHKIVNCLLLLVLFLSFVLVNLNLIVFNFTKLLISTYKYDNLKIEKLLQKNLYLQTHYFIKNIYLLNSSIKNLVNFYNNQGLYDKTEKLYEKNFTVISDFNNKKTSVFYDNSNENLAKIYSELGDIKLNLAKYKEAERLYNKAIELKTLKKNLSLETYHKIKIHSNEWRELNKLAFVKIRENNYKEAENYLKKASIIYQEYNNDLSWEIIYNLSILNKYNGNLKLAKKYAEYLLIHMPFEKYPVPDSKEAKAKYILELVNRINFFKQNLADIYVQDNKNEEAINLLKENISINKNLNNESSICMLCNHYQLYEIYKKEKMSKEKDNEYKIISSCKKKLLSTKDLEDEMLLKKLNILCKKWR